MTPQEGWTMMGIMLAVRGMVGVVYAIRIGTTPPEAWTPMFGLLVDYLIIDGMLGFVVGALSIAEGVRRGRPRETDLGIVISVDAGGRIASGIAVHVWPGIPDFPVSAVAFIGIMAACTAMVGMAEARLTVAEEVARHGRRHERAQFAAWTVALSSAAALLFGVITFVEIGDPARIHSLLAAYILAAGGVMLGMAWSRRGRRSWLHESPGVR
jgi:hypothetical protein